MRHTIPHHVDHNEIDREVDDFFAAGARLTKAFIHWLARQAGAVETSRRSAAERETPAQGDGGLLTLQEAAKFLNVTDQTVHAWRKRGIIEGLQFGEEWRFERDELIKAGRKTQASKKPLRMVS